MRGFLKVFFLVVLAILSLTFSIHMAHAQEGFPVIEWDKRQLAEDRLTAFGDDILGDQIDPHTGTLIFEHTDISIPGNSSLEVAIRRRRSQGFLYHEQVNTKFADWELMVPRIKVTTVDNMPWEGNRCSDSFNSQFRIFTRGSQSSPTYFFAKDYSTGVVLDVPGYGSEQILENPVGSQWPNGTTHVTQSNWYFTCTSATDGGQGFVGTAPNGDKYTFNKLIKHRTVNLGVVNGSNLDRTTYILAATEVRDVHNNTVNYEYTNQDLTRIYANDGREITLDYISGGSSDPHDPTNPDNPNDPDDPTNPDNPNDPDNDCPQGKDHCELNGLAQQILTPNNTAFNNSTNNSNNLPSNLISTISANGRTWSYEYDQSDYFFPVWLKRQGGRSSSQVLRKVVQPDQQFWLFNLDDMNAVPSPAKECGDANSYSAIITHPYGAKGTFAVRQLYHRYALGNAVRQADFCQALDDWPPAPGDPLQPTATDLTTTPVMSVTSKSLTGPATTPQNWIYSYEQDEAPSGSSEDDQTNWTRVIGAGTNIKYYHSWNKSRNYYQGNTLIKKFPKGKLLKKETYDSYGNVIETTEYDYISDAEYGRTFVDQYLPKPQLNGKTVIKRNGDTFTTETDYNTNRSSSAYSYGKPIESRAWSNYVISGEANKRITQTTYEHKKDKWILGLPKTVTRNGRLLKTYNYTAKGQVEEVYPYGQSLASAIYDYNPDGTMKTVTVPVTASENRVTTASDWKRGKPQLVTYNDQSTIGRSVDDNGWIMSQTDAKDRTTSYQRDSMGRLTRITPHTPALGQGSKMPDTTIDYFFGATTVQMITTWPKREFVYYDSMLRPVNTLTHDFTNSKQIWTRTQYDALGRPIFKSQPSTVPWEANGVDTEYDALGRVTQTRENVAPYATTTHQYLSNHRKKVTDPEGNAVTTYQYGWDGPDSGVPYLIRQHGITDTWIRRNVHGEIWRVDQTGTSGGFTSNQQQHFYYDSKRRLCRTRTPEGGDTIYRYNAADEVIAYAKGQSAINYCTSIYDNAAKVSLSYDDLGRLKDTIFHDGITPNIERAYDLNGNITQNYRGQGTAKEVLWDYSYDGNDRLKSEELVVTGNKAFDISYLYNGYGHMFRKYLPSGKGISYFNDALGRHTKVSWGSETYAENASYHPSGPLESLTFGNDQVYTQTLNSRLLPYTLNVTDGTNAVQEMQYHYDKNGRVQYQTNHLNPNDTRYYQYDSVGRLKQANSAAWGQAEYSYDPLGNLRKKYFSGWTGGPRTVTNNYSSKNRIASSIDTANIAYGFGYDTRGNVTQTGLLSFTYDRSDQPIAMNGQAPNTRKNINASYLYDGNMKRVRSVVDGKTIYNVYDLSGRLVHVEDDGEVTDYLHGMGQTLARIKDGEFTYLHPDHLGSPQVGTNEAGGVAFTESYTPYGEELLSPAANDNQSGFTGHIKDKSTGLNYMQARYYDSNIGRFLSIDPVTFIGSGYNPSYFNRYAYSGNDPINRIDPTGESWESLKTRVKVAYARAATKLQRGTDEDGNVTYSSDNAIENIESGISKASKLPFAAATGGLIRPKVRGSGTTPKPRDGSPPPSHSPEGAGRAGAFKAAKRDNNIPVTQQPDSVTPNVDKRGDTQPGRQYNFTNNDGNSVTIRDDAAGHQYTDGPDRGPHFNDDQGRHYDYPEN